MSLLVHYTLKSAEHHDAQIAAMTALVGGLKSENIAGIAVFLFFDRRSAALMSGVLEFVDEAAKQGFLESKSFATYRDTVGPTFANPPQTTEISAIASTRGLRGACLPCRLTHSTDEHAHRALSALSGF